MKLKGRQTAVIRSMCSFLSITRLPSEGGSSSKAPPLNTPLNMSNSCELCLGTSETRTARFCCMSVLHGHCISKFVLLRGKGITKRKFEAESENLNFVSALNWKFFSRYPSEISELFLIEISMNATRINF